MKVTAVNAADGARIWTEDKENSSAAIYPAGPRFVVINGNRVNTSGGYYEVIDARTGAERPDISQYAKPMTTTTFGLNCYYDDVEVTVCDGTRPNAKTFEKEKFTFGFDAKTGKKLWELPELSANRTAITATSAYHGAVYGTTEDGAVVLDAKTGQDREVAAGVAPYAVSGSFGVAFVEGKPGLYAVPAVA
jgi:outer membrane protein assembly factor BamB